MGSGCRLDNQLEIEQQRFTAFACLVYINISVASSFPFFSSKLTRGELYEELLLVLIISSKSETEFLDCADKYGHVESW